MVDGSRPPCRFIFAVLAQVSNRTTVGWSAHEQVIGAHS